MESVVIRRSDKTRGERRSVTVKAEVEKITPEKAIRWLEDTEKSEEVRNRGISESNVSLFAENMTRGTWEVSHQGVALYRHGSNRWVVLDGQHRLWAIVKAAIPVNMMVARYENGNIEEAIEIMKTFDRGQKRNLGQVLKIASGVERGSTRASVVRYLLAFLKGGGSADHRFFRIIDSEILSGVQRYEADLDWFVTLRRGHSFLSAPVGAAFIYAHSIPQFQEAIEKFGRQYSGGEGLYMGDPPLSLHDWIKTQGSDNLLRRPEGRMRLMRVTFTALMKSVQGKKISRFYDDNLEGFEFFRNGKTQRTETTRLSN